MSLKKIIPNKQFFTIVADTIRSGRSIEIKVKGDSMYPTLISGRHKVVLSPYREEYLRLGIIALFIYKGRYVLHRLVAKEGDTLTFQGDNLPYTKEPVTKEDIIAFVEFIITPHSKIIDCKRHPFPLTSRLRVFMNRARAVAPARIKSMLGSAASQHALPETTLQNEAEGNESPGKGHCGPAANKTVPPAVKKTKVLFFIESLAGGGAEKVLSTIVNHIDKDKFDITVSSVTAEGVYVGQVSRAVKFRPMIRRRKGLYYRSLYNLIYYVLPMRWVYSLFVPKGNDVEVAFCEGFATRLIARSPAKRKIAWVHTDLVDNPWTQGTVYPSVEAERKAYSEFPETICVSDTVKRSFELKFGLHGKTLYNPIDSDMITALAKEEAELPARTRIRFVTAGRLVPQKGYDRLLKVVKILRDKGYDFELWILGDGVGREELERYINEEDLGDWVTIWGFMQNPYPYIYSGDVFVCSSRCEGYSTAATEALILGLPVITTLCSGMEELLGGTGCGYIVENTDEALVEPLEKVLCDGDALAGLKAGAAERGRDFRIETLIKPVEQLLL